jgi:type III restriction enzyme
LVVNAVRSPNSSLFSRGFLIVTPGITIRDRLRVLLPSDPENYYATRHLMPQEMLLEMVLRGSGYEEGTPNFIVLTH